VGRRESRRGGQNRSPESGGRESDRFSGNRTAGIITGRPGGGGRAAKAKDRGSRGACGRAGAGRRLASTRAADHAAVTAAKTEEELFMRASARVLPRVAVHRRRVRQGGASRSVRRVNPAAEERALLLPVAVGPLRVTCQPGSYGVQSGSVSSWGRPLEVSSSGQNRFWGRSFQRLPSRIARAAPATRFRGRGTRAIRLERPHRSSTPRVEEGRSGTPSSDFRLLSGSHLSVVPDVVDGVCGERAFGTWARLVVGAIIPGNRDDGHPADKRFLCVFVVSARVSRRRNFEITES